MTTTRRVAITVIGTLLSATLAFAHHGWSSYDEKTELNVDGTIREATWGNPHGTAKLEVDGKVWDVVLAPTSRMQARGLTEAMLAPGTKARVVGYPHRQQASEMRAERITIGDRTVELR
jgi:hypothetical protein